MKKIPMRMCTGCGEMKPKKELVRIVHSADGNVVIDHTGRLSGRGAYICHDPECLRKARKAKRLDKAFSSSVPDEVYDALEKELSENE